MRVASVLLFLALPAPVFAQSPEPAPAPGAAAGNPAGEDELELAVMLTAQAYREQLDALRSMQDAVSAANALPRLRRAMCIRYKLYGMSFDDAEYSGRCDQLVREDVVACARELQRLREASYYGVLPVRDLFFDTDPTIRASVGETLLAASPLPAEELEEMAECLRLEMADYQKAHNWLVGGPGFSRETAWVITDDNETVQHERHFVRTVLRAAPCGQTLHEVDGRLYDRLFSVVTVNGEPYRLEQWFDVTLHHKCCALQNAEDQVAEDSEAEPEPTPAEEEEEELVAEEVDEEGPELIAEDPDLDE